MGKREAIVFILLASFTLLCNGLFCDADTGICTEENNHASRATNDTCCQCAPLQVNTHFGDILQYAPSGLCCPARRSIVLSVSSPQSSSGPSRVLGVCLLQDSRLSLGVSCSLQNSLFSSGQIVQMWLLAQPITTNTSQSSSQSSLPPSPPPVTTVSVLLSSLILPPTTINQTSSSSSSSLTTSMSSFSPLPLSTMLSPVGYAIWIVFRVAPSPWSALQQQQQPYQQQLYQQLYQQQQAQLQPWQAYFPPRTSF